VLADAGTVTINGVTLQSEAAASLTIAGTQATIQTNGAAQQLLLSGVRGKKLRLNGIRITAPKRKGILVIAVPAGEHTFTME
jgi:hypothetical protein